VGEITALRPLVRAIRKEYPDLKMVISATTLSGQQTASRLFPELAVVAFPLDFPFAVSSFLRRINPQAVVLAELEIWPNFLRSAARLGIPMGIVNGRITEESLTGYQRVQKLLPQFDCINLYGVQNKTYAQRFAKLNVPEERIKVTGNLKFENLPDISESASEEWLAYLGERRVLCLASTHEDEELQLCSELVVDSSFEDVVVMIVPRHPRRANAILKQLAPVLGERPLILRSSLKPGQSIPPGSFVLVDSFGELEDLYRLSACVFVGGSLVAHGGQNMLEAAALAKPVVMGPYHRNFRDEVALLESVAALRTSPNVATLLGYLREWLDKPLLGQQAGQAGLVAMADGQGATARTMQLLKTAKILPTQ